VSIVETVEQFGYADQTKTLKNAEWANSHSIRDNVVEEVNRLKQGAGQDLLIFGSIDLVNSLIPHGVIDEYRLLLYPVVLGSGKRLFKEGSKATLNLTTAQAFGPVPLLRYEQGAA
jgi:dihydrofolate reductase